MSVLYFDGGARPNPGKAAGAFVLDGQEGGKQIPFATNNQAEYIGLIEGLKAAKEKGIKQLIVRGDSMLVIMQMQGKYKVKAADLIPLHAEAKELSNEMKITFEHIPRSANTQADVIATKLIQKIE